MRILVVEDDALLAEGLVKVLTRAGHIVEHDHHRQDRRPLARRGAIRSRRSRHRASRHRRLRGAARLRARRSSTLVLVLTARDAVEDRVHGLDLGAEDYLTKPFSLNEFEARVRALLRRNVPLTPRWTIGGLDRRPRRQARARRRAAGRSHAARMGAARAVPDPAGPRAQQGADRRQPVRASTSSSRRTRSRSMYRDCARRSSRRALHIRTVRGFGYLWAGGDE